MSQPIRVRTAELLRRELVNQAYDLLVERGYAALTAEDLAAALGISRATFFRTLRSKDEVIVAALLGEEQQFGSVLRATPPAPEATSWQRIRTAFEPAIVAVEHDEARQLAAIGLVEQAGSLETRLRRARLEHLEGLAAALIDEGVSSTTAHTLAAAAIAVYDHCWTTWAQHGAESVRDAVDRAFADLDHAGITSATGPGPEAPHEPPINPTDAATTRQKARQQ